MQLTSLFLVFIIGLIPTALQAKTAAGIDLVYVLDQSGTMMRSSKGDGCKGGGPNDPDGKRIEALHELAMKNLLDSSNQGFVNRLVVVEFGGRFAKAPKFQPQITLNTQIPPYMYQTAAWSLIQGEIKNIQSVCRGDTDHGKALDIAYQELSKLKTAEPQVEMVGGRSGARQQLVVLITDGATAIQDYAPNAKVAHSIWEVKGIPLRDEITATAEKFRQEKITFVVLGINDTSDYWQQERWGDFWTGAATLEPATNRGMAYLVKDKNDIFDKILSVTSQFICQNPSTCQINSTSSSQNYDVPPYLKAVDLTLEFFKPNPDLSKDVKITLPDGTTLPPPTKMVSPYRAQLTVDNPPSGKWELVPNSNANYKVVVNPVYESVKLLEPNGLIQIGEDTSFRYQLAGKSAKKLFEEIPQLPVKFQLTLNDSQGVASVYDLNNEGHDGLVSTPQKIKLTTAGTYTAELTGKVLLNGNEQVVYQSNPDQLAVTNLTAVELKLEEPDSDNGITLGWNGQATVPVKFSFHEVKSGNLVDPLLMLNSNVIFNLGYEVEGDTAQQTPAPELKLTKDALLTDLPLDFKCFKWEWLLQQGKIKFILQPKAAEPWKTGKYHYVSVKNGDYLTTAWLPLKEGQSLIWLLGLLAIVIIGSVVYLLWQFVGRDYGLKARDQRNNYKPYLIFQVEGDDSTREEWALTQSQVKPTRNKVFLNGSDEWRIAGFKIKRLSAARDNQVRVQIHYRKKSDNKAAPTIELVSDNDYGSSSASGRIQGLEQENGIEAKFTLYVGLQD